jgi:hypothetical protein
MLGISSKQVTNIMMFVDVACRTPIASTNVVHAQALDKIA